MEDEAVHTLEPAGRQSDRKEEQHLVPDLPLMRDDVSYDAGTAEHRNGDAELLRELPDQGVLGALAERDAAAEDAREAPVIRMNLCRQQACCRAGAGPAPSRRSPEVGARASSRTG
ncbi:hypothetical protein [Methylobacterium sp. P5_C11]